MTIINLADRKKKEEPPTEEELDLTAVEEKNKKNKERVERERKSANQQVLNSYRIRRKK